VKKTAQQRGLPIYQPERLNAEAIARVSNLEIDVVVVVAYGLILPPELLRVPPRGCVNLHASLLPRYRGAAPVAHAILREEAVTGVTTLLMDEGIDTGPILLQRQSLIGPQETAGEVEERLALIGAELLGETLSRMERGDLTPRPQVFDRDTYAPKVSPAEGRIQWADEAKVIDRRVRAFNPRPGAFTHHRGHLMKIWRVVEELHGTESDTIPGTILEDRKVLRVACGGGTALQVLELQMEGRRRMGGEEAMRGRSFSPGELLGQEREGARDSSGHRLRDSPES
jgi:methionyl-tRNA formyltransferase